MRLRVATVTNKASFLAAIGLTFLSVAEWKGKSLGGVSATKQLVSGHKLGFVLSHKLIGQLKHNVTYSKLPGCSSSNPGCTKVHVLRHLADALTSGFLYHKSGRECWLNEIGKPNPKHSDEMGCQGVRGGNSHFCRKYLPHDCDKDGTKLNLCEFLRHEEFTLECRVATFVKFAMNKWYGHVFEALNDASSTKICMEDLLKMENSTAIDRALDIQRRPIKLSTELVVGHAMQDETAPQVRLQVYAAIVVAIRTAPGVHLGADGVDVSLGCQSQYAKIGQHVDLAFEADSAVAHVIKLSMKHIKIMDSVD